MRLSLARDPFVNQRPLERLARALWALGVVLVLLAGFLFARYLAGSAELRGQLRQVRDEIAQEQSRTRALEQELLGYDVTSQNERIDFLNLKIEQRTFRWGRLFERISEVLPERVRLHSLSPSVTMAGDPTRRSRQSTRGDETRATLQIVGTAEGAEDLLAFVDNLFQHPAFEQPNLSGENTTEVGELRFAMSMGYLPDELGALGPQQTSAGAVESGVETTQARPVDPSARPTSSSGVETLAQPTPDVTAAVPPPDRSSPAGTGTVPDRVSSSAGASTEQTPRLQPEPAREPRPVRAASTNDTSSSRDRPSDGRTTGPRAVGVPVLPGQPASAQGGATGSEAPPGSRPVSRRPNASAPPGGGR